MDDLARRPAVVLLIVAILLAAVLVGQAATDSLSSRALDQTGAAIGRAGYAYLGGFRIFAAAVIWNRLEPVFHEYYEDIPLEEQVYMLPSVQAVIALDPQFTDSYYVASWVLARRGDTVRAFAIARQGVENNPTSGTLRASYAQILLLFDGDIDEAVRQADLGISESEWASPSEQHDAYAIFGAVYRRAGLDAKFDRVMHEIERLDAILGDTMPEGTHDHDGDGVPDH